MAIHRAALYCRVSTDQQTCENQLAELRAYALARRWHAVEFIDEGVSGSKDRRPALDRLVADARRRKLDTVVVWRLDRLGRSLKHLVTLLDELQALGVGFVSLGEGIDLQTPAGRLQLHILAALSEFERARCVERVQAGLARARRQGKTLGRPQRIITPFALAKVAGMSSRESRQDPGRPPIYPPAVPGPKSPLTGASFSLIFLSKTGRSDPRSGWPVYIRWTKPLRGRRWVGHPFVRRAFGLPLRRGRSHSPVRSWATPGMSQVRSKGAPMTALRQRMLEDMQVRNLSAGTQQVYVEQVCRFARHFGRSPAVLGPEEIRAYQVYLTNEKQLAPATLVIVVAALRFLYRVTLQQPWSIEAVIPAPKQPHTLPVVLSPAEVGQFLDRVKNPKHRTILTTCYAAGLRISEAVRLTVSAIDSQRMVLRVVQGKGQRDRYVMLSPTLLALLRDWWRVHHPPHWLFPGARPDQPITIHAVDRACRRVQRRCGIPKPITGYIRVSQMA